MSSNEVKAKAEEKVLIAVGVVDVAIMTVTNDTSEAKLKVCHQAHNFIDGIFNEGSNIDTEMKFAMMSRITNFFKQAMSALERSENDAIATLEDQKRNNAKGILYICDIDNGDREAYATSEEREASLAELDAVFGPEGVEFIRNLILAINEDTSIIDGKINAFLKGVTEFFCEIHRQKVNTILDIFGFHEEILILDV